MPSTSSTKNKKINQTILELILVIVLALGFGLLGGKIASGNSHSAAIDSTTWISKIKKAGVLRVGMAEDAPTISQAKDGQWQGPYTVVAAALANELGVKVQYVETSWANIVAGIQSDKYDLAAGLDITLPRSLAVGFTNPVTGTNNVLLVKKTANVSTVAEAESNALPIAAPQGSAQESALKLSDKNLLSIDSFANGIQAVISGRAIAAIVTGDTAVQTIQSNDSLRAIVPANPIDVSISAFGVARDIDFTSLQTINAAISDTVYSGQVSASYTQANIPSEIQDGRVVPVVPQQYQK
ncbi:polar amino acid transport system substrate-binding protein [Propionibacterium cyclohexanicum]|uniref:Polar amino acid transport system substrate-binding protein n=1 Tax=Propionibacterium cyclohexanicum TaxID=64702 RepID=A0A1H9RYT8_9ACTN|nr:transporter substrate-binding domain-containing protein [Propionibacterium cyclohexanicum]SER77921.1 polar amino acid transport system substrate-binding protein [Propionibacterium cyclohexanicum]